LFTGVFVFVDLGIRVWRRGYGDAIFFFGPRAKVDELASFGAERAVRVFGREQG
jgi:hypothetical protein